MKNAKLLMTAILVMGATAMAERSHWTNVEQVKGTATYNKASNGLKYCTHDKARFAHTYSNGTEVVLDKQTQRSAKYYSDASLSKRGLHILVNADRTEGMPNYIAKTDRGVIYFDKLNEMQKGIADRGFKFETVADPEHQTYTLNCAKE